MLRSNGDATDEHPRFSTDQFFIELLGRDVNAVVDVGEFQLSKQIEQCGLVKGQRVVPFVQGTLIGSD